MSSKTLLSLPNDLLFVIFDLLPYSTLKILERVSKSVQALLALPALARRLFKQPPEKDQLARHLAKGSSFTLHPALVRRVGLGVSFPIRAGREFATSPALVRLQVVLLVDMEGIQEERMIENPEGVSVEEVIDATETMLDSDAGKRIFYRSDCQGCVYGGALDKERDGQDLFQITCLVWTGRYVQPESGRSWMEYACSKVSLWVHSSWFGQ